MPPPLPLSIVDRRSDPYALGYMTALLCLNCQCYHLTIYTRGCFVETRTTCPVCLVHGSMENKGCGKCDGFLAKEDLRKRIVLEQGDAFVVTSERIAWTEDGMVTNARPVEAPRLLCAATYDTPAQETP